MHAAVIFNEIAWMGTTESSNGEWIELYNDGEAGVALGGVYEAGGETLSFALSGTIAPRSYYLIERTTPSVGDPLPGIGNEAGSFGGSGLSNSGEFLVLKDASGNVLDSLDHRTGWLAGSASTKETMQRFGSEWKTATATPGIQNKEPFAILSASSTVATTSASQAPSAHSGAVVVSSPDIENPFEVSAGRERLATVGTPVRFEARTKGVKTVDATFEWSFGDGSAGRGASVQTTYAYPGEYVVVLNAISAGNSAVARTKVKVVPLEVSISADLTDSRVVVENSSRFELNLGEWRISVDGQMFQVPRDTIILPGSLVVFPSKVTKFAVTGSSTPYLIYPDGTGVQSLVRTRALSSDDELERLRRMLVEAFGKIESILKQ